MTVLAIHSTSSAAPTLSGTAGTLIGVFDACLIVNKVFSTANDSSFNDNTTEARLEGGTAFTLLPTPASGDRTYIGMPVTFKQARFNFAVVGVGGTYVWEYWNGSTWSTLTVTDGTSGFTANGTVTWTIPGDWATNAINSVTQYWVRVRASANPSTNPTVNYITVGGWTKAFTGTNLAAYRQGSGSNGFFLRIDDTGTTSARSVGYETMSDINTGTGPFPTSSQVSGGLYLVKSGTADSTARPWSIVFSEKLFHLLVSTDSSSTGVNSAGHTFGDIKSYKSGDVYATIHIASTSTLYSGNTLTALVSVTNTTTGHYLCRSYTQIGSSLACGKHSDGVKGSSSTVGLGNMTYPNPEDGGLYLAPIWAHESAGNVRGEIPGLWAPCHNRPLNHLDTFSGTGALAGKTFLAWNQYNNGQIFIETSDTWNT